MPQYKIFFLDHRSCYLNSLGDALAQMGHRIFYQTSWNMNEIEAGIAYFQPDVLITVGCDTPLMDASIVSLKDICRTYDVFHLYWATEDQIHHRSWSLPYVERMEPDLVWTIYADCVASYEQRGIQAAYLNFGFNPRIFPAKRKDQVERYQVSFVGTTHLDQHTFRYESLRQLLFPFVKQEIETNIWGFGWENESLIASIFQMRIPKSWLHHYLPYKETSNVYQQSKVVLGVQNARDQVTQRTFEILGSGAFMIASRTEALTELFVEDEEVVLSDDAEETLEKYHYYIQRPEQRYAIGRRARQKVLQTHTYEQRLRNVWPQLASYLDRK